MIDRATKPESSGAATGEARPRPGGLCFRIRRAAARARTTADRAQTNGNAAAGAASRGSPRSPDANKPDARRARAPRASRGAGREPSRDAFGVYIRSLQKSYVLSAEDEHELAVRYREHNDEAAAARLVAANLRLVVKIAEEYGRASDQLLDLIQEGNLGLFHAVQRFDPYRGVKLSSYAAWWIRAYILKFLLANCRVVRLGTTLAQRKLFYKLRSERERLQNEGIEVEPHHLAEALQVKESEVREMELRLASPDASLDSPLRGDAEGGTLSNFVHADPAGRPDVQVEAGEFHDRLKRTFQKFQQGLTERERQIFAERLLAEEPVTLQEIGRRYGVSRERARQLEVRLKKKVRQFLATEFADSADWDAAA